MPKAILFDWDNTLVNTWPTIHASLNHTLRTMGHPEWSLEEVKASVKRSMRDSFPELFGDAWEKAANEYQSHYRSVHLENLEALPDAESMLQWLKQQDRFVGVVSNKKGNNLRDEVEHIGWGKYFDVIIGAQDAEHDKPHPAPVNHALEHASLPANQDVWFIGDTTIDLECAQNAGVTGVLYGDVATENSRYQGVPFAHHAISHTALQDLLNKAFNAAA